MRGVVGRAASGTVRGHDTTTLSQGREDRMPIYEYRCQECRTRVQLFWLPPEVPDPVCTRCGSRRLTRIISRVARVRSEEDRLESLADDPSLAEVDEHDPRSVARFMRRMGRELGEDLGDDFDQAVEELEAGGAGGEGEEGESGSAGEMAAAGRE
ncbi:MAG: zinc ribbon domain-containing protein [Armatimonadota bacterium]|nr:zinc ribbon domain-containing protein [Armatimonadota bacterium]MDR7449306.1 zinc ribbon domain-containing protein [Armatimonadota bacterium]MDR7460775.1 zinc ribbon domain-containing protein [Armatimonadota bacterium]MDR7479971.1 zinc ribbon domain-containing protein [Armatimonadota bacterium]MDR7488639.1 zinc ribbon domain-containing protein [Armatimonadota bacterium]